MKTALVLIDIQNDYFPEGRMELAGSEAAGEAAGRLLRACRAAGLPIVHIRHIAAHPGATFFLPGTEGADIHPCVTPLADEAMITKHFPNAFRDTTLKAHLAGLDVTRLIVAGMMTHMCVDTTVRAAFDLGFACTLAHDACATRDMVFAQRTVAAADVQAAYMAALDGMFASVRATDTICANLYD